MYTRVQTKFMTLYRYSIVRGLSLTCIQWPEIECFTTVYLLAAITSMRETNGTIALQECVLDALTVYTMHCKNMHDSVFSLAPLIIITHILYEHQEGNETYYILCKGLSFALIKERINTCTVIIFIACSSEIQYTLSMCV